MREIEKEELYLISGGGVPFSGTVLSALSTLAKTVLEVGRSLGSSLRRSYTGDLC